MIILFSMLVTIAVVALAIEVANWVAYGWFAGKWQKLCIRCELETSRLSPFDFERISTERGYVSIVPISLFSTYYYSPDEGRPARIFRFSQLHRDIERKFKELQEV